MSALLIIPLSRIHWSASFAASLTSLMVCTSTIVLIFSNSEPMRLASSVTRVLPHQPFFGNREMVAGFSRPLFFSGRGPHEVVYFGLVYILNKWSPRPYRSRNLESSAAVHRDHYPC